MNKKTDYPPEAILLVAFGTSVSEAAKPFESIERRVREKYPGVEIRWAFTSNTIRSRLEARGQAVDSPERALSGLVADGYTLGAILSLHVVAGKEYEDLCRVASRFSRMAGGFKSFEIARPLLGNNDDMKRVAGILAGEFARKNPGEGVIFIGHGNPKHSSDSVYTKMNSLFMGRETGFFVGTIQGNLTPENLLPEIKAANICKVRLVPLMTTAGGHARKDMAGDGSKSWKSVLSRNGIVSEPLFRGLAEDPEIVSVWLDHLAEAIARL